MSKNLIRRKRYRNYYKYNLIGEEAKKIFVFKLKKMSSEDERKINPDVGEKGQVGYFKPEQLQTHIVPHSNLVCHKKNAKLAN